MEKKEDTLTLQGVMDKTEMVSVNHVKFTDPQIIRNYDTGESFFIVKGNGIPLDPIPVSEADIKFINATNPGIQELMERFQPLTLKPQKVMDTYGNVEIDVPFGKQSIGQLNDFVIYTDNKPESPTFGKELLFVDVSGEKMTAVLPDNIRQELNHSTMSPTEVIPLVFGDRINLPQYYSQFTIPKDVAVYDVSVNQNQTTGKYEITATIEGKQMSPIEISDNDAKSLLEVQSASERQLAAKYFSGIIEAEHKSYVLDCMNDVIDSHKRQGNVDGFNTVNGDEISDPQFLKDNNNALLFVKINGIQQAPVNCTLEEMEAYNNNKINLYELAERHFPSKLEKRLDESLFNKPSMVYSNGTETGQELGTLQGFQVFCDNTYGSPTEGKIMVYANVNGQGMTEVMPEKFLEAYANRTMSPAQMIPLVFGDRIGLPEYYQQFQPLEGLEAKNIYIQQNPKTDKYEISVKFDNFMTPPREMSYNDTNSLFSHAASSSQLASKYFGTDYADLQKKDRSMDMAVGKSRGMSI